MEKPRYEDDTMILVSKKARQKFKFLALDKGQTVKEYLEEVAYENYNDYKKREDRLSR